MALREKCLYAELFWSLFSRIRTEYGKILCISPYSIRIGGNTQQSNSEYRHFSRRARLYKNLNFHSWIPAHQDKYHRNYFQIRYYWKWKKSKWVTFFNFYGFFKKMNVSGLLYNEDLKIQILAENGGLHSPNSLTFTFRLEFPLYTSK